MAILFGVVGFFHNPFLVFIAIFVYLGAQAEAGLVEMQSAIGSLRVGDAMMTRFRTLSAHDSLAKAVDELLAGSQQDFPVVESEMPVGILRRNDLVKALTQNRQDSLVSDFMSRNCDSVDVGASLTPIVELMRQKDCGSVAVIQGGRIVGLLTLENISEMIMINTALEQNSRGLGQRRIASSLP
jgi:predicted transcriptional regulator